MSKNILVTGGAGFIGSHTVDLLISKGYKVTVLDDLSTGRKENINKKAKFIFSDIVKADIKQLKNIDAVIHCAAQISVTRSVSDPLNDARTNILGSLKMLDICRKLKIKKFLFSSTAGVYGLNPLLPALEKFANPGNPYAIAKRSVEIYMNFYRQTYGTECVSLRYSNVYGPRQNYLGEAGVITVFIGALLKNKKPTIFGDGKQTRDFVYVGDVASANLKALDRKTHSSEINIGTQTQITINNLLSKIKKIMGKGKIGTIYGNKRKGDVRSSSLDISLARKELGWKPSVRLDEGLEKTVKWFTTQKLYK